MNSDKMYHNRKRETIDGFFVVCATAKETGLPYDILLASDGADERISGCPRIGVIVGDEVIPVSITNKPEVLSDICFDREDAIKSWISEHGIELLGHWNNELSDREILERVSLYHEFV